MSSRIVELARKMRAYGLWGGQSKVTSKDGRFVLGPPPGKLQRGWTAEVMYLEDAVVGYWIGADDAVEYNTSAISEEELHSYMETLFLDWLEAPKLDYEPDPDADAFITRCLDPLLLVGLTEIEKTQWEIDIFLVNVGKKEIQVTIKATGKHFCFIQSLGESVCCDGSDAYTPHILVGIISHLKIQLREWWKTKLFLDPVVKDPSKVAEEPLMASCDEEGVWTINYAWIAWAAVKGHLGNTPTGAITHAIMTLEKRYCLEEHDQVICEKVRGEPLQFKLYQITKTLVKPEKKGE